VLIPKPSWLWRERHITYLTDSKWPRGFGIVSFFSRVFSCQFYNCCRPGFPPFRRHRILPWPPSGNAKPQSSSLVCLNPLRISSESREPSYQLGSRLSPYHTRVWMSSLCIILCRLGRAFVSDDVECRAGARFQHCGNLSQFASAQKGQDVGGAIPFMGTERTD
jgi:hypothetical protein